MRRLMRCRESRVNEQVLRFEQEHFLATNQDFVSQLTALYTPVFIEYEGWRAECLEHYADPHDKRDLRICAHDDLFTGGIKRTNFQSKVLLYQVEYKMKKNDWAKHGKEPRVIGNLGVPASLQGFRTAKYMKMAQEKTIELENGTLWFCPTSSHDNLQRVFDAMLNPKLDYFFACFSDDSVLAIRTEDGVKWYNLDVKSCDASHGPKIFSNFVKTGGTTAMRQDLALLVDQLRVPIVVHDLASKDRVTLKKRDNMPTLFSGTTITTGVNNFASLLIGYSIIKSLATTERQIQAAARRVGYMLDIEHCPIFEDVQFLKHSPVLDKTGQWRPLLNLGVLLRLSGTVTGDCPGRGDLRARGDKFQYSLLQGAYPSSSFPLIDNLKSTCTPHNDSAFSDVVSQQLRYKVGQTVRAEFYSEDVFRRYRCTPADIEIVTTGFGLAGYGTLHANPSLDKIMRRDYGLSAVRPRDTLPAGSFH